MDDIDLDNIEDLTCEKVGEAINRTIDRLERLQALYTAVAESDRRRVERLVQEWRREQRRSTTQPAASPGAPPSTSTEKPGSREP